MPIADSFETLVEDAVYARIQAAMGDGGQYQDPPYLQIKHFVRTAGEPIPGLPEREMPFVWLEYVGGIQRGTVIGSPLSMDTEVFMLYGQVSFIPELVGVSPDDVNEFVRLAKANAGTWARRLRRLMSGWVPDVQCPVSGHKVATCRATAYGLGATLISPLKRQFTATIRLELGVEP